MSVDKLQKLYDNISQDYDLPDYDQFKKDMSDPVKSNKLHETLIGDEWDVPEYDQFTTDLGLKKKEFTQEELDTSKASLLGYSEVPKELGSETPSTSSDPEQPTYLDIVNVNIKDVSDRREKLASERESIAWNKIHLERDVKRIERELSDAKSALYTSTGRERNKPKKTTQQLEEELKTVKSQFSQISKNLSTEIDREQDLESAADLLEKSKRLLEAPDENSLKAFKEGLTSPLAKDFFTIGVGQMARQYNILDIANKVRDGGLDSLNDEERTALGTYGMFQMISEDPKAVSYNVGKGVAEMIPYVTQFALTGGVGELAKAGTKTLLKAATKKGIKRALTEGAAYAAGALARTPLLTMTQEDFARRSTGGVQPILKADDKLEGELIEGTEADTGEAVYKAFATTFAEAFTEELGGAITKPLKGLGKYIGKSKLIKKVPNTIITKAKDAIKFHGAIGEYSEELVNGYLQAALTGDQKLSEVWDGKEQLETALTVATVGGAIMGAGKVASTLKKDQGVLVQKRDEAFENIDDKYKDEALAISEIEDVEEKADVLDQYIYDRNLNEDQIKNVTDFVLTDNAIAASNIVQENTQEESLEAEEEAKVMAEDETIQEETKATEEAVLEEADLKKETEEQTEEVAEEVAEVKEETKEEVEEEKKDIEEAKYETVEAFKTDFLADDVNLNQIDVPLSKADRIAAAKNLREGKKTKQAEILETYLNEAFERGNLGLIAEAAGGKTVRTDAPIESIIKPKETVAEEVKEIIKPKAKPIKVEVVEPLTAQEAQTRIRGTEQGIFQAKDSEQQKFVQELVDANKESYDVLSYEAATENAKKYIAEQGSVDQAYEQLKEKTAKVEDLATRQVARLSLVDYYSRQAIDENVPEAAQDVAVEKLITLEKAVAREATGAGQASAVLNIWKAKQPEAVLKIETKKIEEYNKGKLEKKIDGKTTVKEQINKVAETIDEESKKAAKDIITNSPKYKRIRSKIAQTKRKPSPAKKRVTKEKIKKEQDYRKERLEKYKKQKGTTLQVGVGLTTEDIEFAGDMLASYVREGFYRVVDMTTKLKSDFKSIGIELNDDQIKEIIAQEKDGKKLETTLREREAKESIPTEAKELGTKIDEIVKEHWETKDALGRDLASKFIDDAGLTTLEAKELADIVLAEYSSQIKTKSEKELTKLLGRSVLPKKIAKRNNVVDKLITASNLGALDTEFYSDLFGEHFGLQKITPEQSKKILQFTNNLQKLKGKGVLEAEVARDFAAYIYEIYPKTKTSEFTSLWLDMAYASLLSGVSTSALNFISAGSNIILKPVRDLVNVSKWIDTVKKHNTKDAKAVYNPFGALVYTPALSGIKFGSKEARKVYTKGGLDNKYIDQVSSDKAFKVSELERGKFGEGKRFKPVNIKVGDKKFDINIFNAYKYSGRNLLAQDKLMFNTIHDIEMASTIADKFAKTGLKGKALNQAVIKELTGQNIDQDMLNVRLENDIATYEEVTGDKVSALDKEIRKREITLDMLDLTPEERNEIEQIARSNIFTDDRGGLIAHAAYGIGRLANTNPVSKVVIKPFVPFTKIVGNVTEYMLDHVPVYGQLRALGWSPTSIYKKLTGVDMLTSQMGEKGTKAYYEQMGRAWLGTAAFLTAAMLGLGSDEDDFVQVTGGRSKEGFQQSGRQNVTPNYTLRIGDVTIPYLNIPSLAIPLGLIGNVNDALQLDMSEGDAMDRLTTSMLLSGGYNTVTMTKDMSIVQGISALTQLVTDVLNADEDRWNKIGNEVAKRYLGFAAKPLPQNINLIKQIEKFFDPTSYSRKDIKEILAYAGGAEHFTNNPSIDQLGDVIETYPGETLLPYTHWLGLKGGDSRWKFLAKYNAIPKKIFNTQKIIETTSSETPFEKRRMTSDEFFEYTQLAGEKFSDGILKYMDKDNLPELNKDKTIDDFTGEATTKIQEDISKLRAKSNADAFTELFRWGVAKKEKPQAFSRAKKYGVVKSYKNTKSITINGKKYQLSGNELYKFNTLVSLDYLEAFSNLKEADLKALHSAEYTDEYGRTKTALDTATDSLWKLSSDKITQEQMAKFIDMERYIKETQDVKD